MKNKIQLEDLAQFLDTDSDILGMYLEKTGIPVSQGQIAVTSLFAGWGAGTEEDEDTFLRSILETDFTWDSEQGKGILHIAPNSANPHATPIAFRVYRTNKVRASTGQLGFTVSKLDTDWYMFILRPWNRVVIKHRDNVLKHKRTGRPVYVTISAGTYLDDWKHKKIEAIGRVGRPKNDAWRNELIDKNPEMEKSFWIKGDVDWVLAAPTAEGYVCYARAEKGTYSWEVKPGSIFDKAIEQYLNTAGNLVKEYEGE